MSVHTDKPIGICVCKIHEESISEICTSVCLEAKKRGYNTAVFNSFIDFYNDTPDSKSSENIFSMINFQKLCGIIILPETFLKDSIAEDIIKSSTEAGIPVVCIDGGFEGCTNILFNYAQAFEKIVRHVVEFHKLKNVYFLAGSKGNAFSDERLEVYKKVLKENNIPIDEKKIGYGDFWDMPAAAETKRFLSESDTLPEAIICANDTMAFTVCRIMTEKGLSVPKDIIVTGFDGIIQEKYHTPRLTTARQNNEKAGVAAVNAMDDILNGKNPPERTVIDYDVVFSQSCGCKRLTYKNINNIVMELYRELHAKDELAINMNDMTNLFKEQTEIRNAMFALKKHIGMMYFINMSINLRKAFFSEEPFDFSKPILKGEEMRSVVIYRGNVPEESSFSFRCGDFKVVNSVCGETPYCIFTFLLKYQEKIYGNITLSCDPKTIRLPVLNYFSMNINHAVDTIKNRADILNVNNRLTVINSQLSEAFIHDSMTGLLNRRGFFMKINEKMRLFPKGYIFVSSIDLNNLKFINDKYGHHEGDFAIKNIAGAVMECCGDEGICARFGGDEFVAVIVFKEKRENIEHEFKKRFSKKISELNTEYTTEYILSASVGIIVSEISSHFDLDDAIRKADAKMYRDKENKGLEIRNYRRDSD